MDKKLIEGMRRMNQIGAWETYGKDAIAVVSQGTPGEYTDNQTVKEEKLLAGLLWELSKCHLDDNDTDHLAIREAWELKKVIHIA